MRRSPWVGPTLAALIAFAWAAWWRQDVDTTLLNADVLYQLHRVQRCLADFPAVTTLDTYTSAGSTQHVAWLGPFTLLLSCIAKLAGAAHASIRELAVTLGLVPPVLGAVTAALTVVLARRFGASPIAAFVAGLGMALSGDALSIFHHGHIHHDVFVPLGVVIAALGWSGRSLPAWIAGHALLFFMTPDATFVSTILVIIAGGSECVGRAWRAGEAFRRAPVFLLAPAAVALAALVATRVLDPSRPAFFEASTFPFSGAHVIWIGASGGFLALAARLIERPMTPSKRFQLLAGSLLALGSGLALVLVLSGQAGSFLDRILGAGGQRAGEMLSLLRLMNAARESHWGGWATILALVAAFSVIWMLRALRRRASALDIHAAGLMLTGSLLAISELRHARAFSPLVVLAMTFAVFETARFITQKAPLSGMGGRVGVGLALALIALPPFVDHALEVRRDLREPATWQRSMGALCEWMRRELPDAGPRDEPATRAVFAPWRWGHHLSVLGTQPVIVDPFSWDGGVDVASEETWLAASSQGFIAAVERRGGTHVVVTTAAASIVNVLPRSSHEILRRMPEAPDGIAYMPELRRYFAFRLDELGGLLDESGRLMPLWISPDASEMAVLDGGQLRVSRVPMARLYEIVAGATLEARASPEAAEMEAELDVSFVDGTQVTLRRRVRTSPDGIARMHVALPAPFKGEGFSTLGPYRLKLGDQTTAVVVTEADVRAGETVSEQAEAQQVTAGGLAGQQ